MWFIVISRRVYLPASCEGHISFSIMRLAAPLLSPDISRLVFGIEVGCTANQLRIPIGLSSTSWKLSCTIFVSTSEAYLQQKYPSLI